MAGDGRTAAANRIRFTAQQPDIAIRRRPYLDADQLSSLSAGDEITACEVFIEEGIEWAKLPKGSSATRVNGTTTKVSLNLKEDGFVPTMDPALGTLLRKHTQVMVEEKKEAGVLTKKEIAEILDRSSDSNMMLPLESKFWTKQQLEMFVMSGGSIRPAWCSIPDERLMANTNMTKEEIIEAVMQAGDWITNADAILIGSGAGMGVDSGLGTFRGNQKGVWAGLDAVGLAYEEICQPKWFAEEPHLGWGFWNFCHEAYQATTPHDGYVRAREWGQRCPLGFFSFTSNIDSHWVASGTSGDRVLEVHGAVKWLQCSKPCAPDVWKAPKDLGLVEDEDTHRVRGVLPTCPKCKAVARPNVQMFGGDSGFSKARRGAQFSRYDGWLKQLEARPDKDSLRVTCIEVGCGLTVPTVRNELESVVRKFPGGRLVRVNPENPGLSTDLAERGVSLPLKAGFAIEELSKQVFKEGDNEVTFILWARHGACEIRAPYGTCLGRLLRLCELEDGISVEFSKNTVGTAWNHGNKQNCVTRLDQPVDTGCFSEIKAGEGSQIQCACALEVEAVFKGESEYQLNSALKLRAGNVHALLVELNAKFESPAYQERAMQCTTRRELTEHIRSVQFSVFPKYGIPASEKGTLIMTAFIGSAQRLPELGHQVQRSMELSFVGHMSQLPTEKQKQPDPLEVTCVAMSKEEGGEEADTLQLEATTQTRVWELRDKLATTLVWDEETARAVKFFFKQGNSYVPLKETEPITKFVYLRNCPPLKAATCVEVTFKEMAPEDDKAPLTYPLSVMSNDSVAELRNILGESLGWDAVTRKRAKFLIRFNKESFGALKDHEKVQARKVIYVHGASLIPTPEAMAAWTARTACEIEEAAQQELDGSDPKEEQEPEPAESAEEMDVSITIDPALEFNIPVRVKKGSTIRSVKQLLADMDPTGRTDMDKFWLRPAGPGGRSLADDKRLCAPCSLLVSQEPPPRPPPRAAAAPGAAKARTSRTGAEPAKAQKYFIAGSWNDFKLVEMNMEGSCFVHTLKVGRNGWESFQILLGGSWATTYYPSVRDANPDKEYRLKGPDDRGHGLNWTIGSPTGKGQYVTKPGSCFKIVISVDDQQLATQVSWRQVPG